MVVMVVMAVVIAAMSKWKEKKWRRRLHLRVVWMSLLMKLLSLVLALALVPVRVSQQGARSTRRCPLR